MKHPSATPTCLSLGVCLLLLACAARTVTKTGTREAIPVATSNETASHSHGQEEQHSPSVNGSTGQGPPELDCSPDECHRCAMQLDLEGHSAEAFSLYADNCERGYGASCHAIGDLAERCLYVAGYPFYEAAEMWLHAACDVRYSRACFALYELSFPAKLGDRPSWVPPQIQCNHLRGVLVDRIAPGQSNPPRFRPEPEPVPLVGAAVRPVSCGKNTCAGEKKACCVTNEGSHCVASESDCPFGEHQAFLACTDASQCAPGQYCCAFNHLAQCADECPMGGFACQSDATCPAEFAGMKLLGCRQSEDALEKTCAFAAR